MSDSPRVVLVTGATDGIGKQTALALAKAGAKVVLHGRSKLKVDAAIASIVEQVPAAELEGVSFDLGNLAGVRKGAEAILAKVPALHVLINNAGIFATERVVTGDGLEASFAVNHVGPFLLTELLLPRMLASAPGPARIINVASIAHSRGRIHLEDLQLEGGWTGYAAYAQSKLANILHVRGLAARYPAERLMAFAVHPGVIGTKLLRQGFGPVRGSTVDVGARTQVRLALAEPLDAASGAYFSDGVETRPAQAALDAVVAARLWDATAALAGVPATAPTA
jgi:NAD(P)-dependent dehydrogenase (short-subunit alcohol dehydrogenase family)